MTSLITPANLHRNAVAELHVLFVEAGAQVLTENEVSKFGRRKHTNGWRIRLTDNLATECTVLTDVNFPWSPISVFADQNLYRVIPHVEQDGWVCTISDQSSIDVFNPIGVTKVVLTQVQNVLSAVQCEKAHKEEFVREFLSYWITDVRTPNVRSLVDLSGKPRETAVWREKEYILIGDNEKQIRLWLSHRDGCKEKQSTSKRVTEEGVFIPLNQLPLPSQYPKTAKQVLTLAQHGGDAAIDVLKKSIKNLTGSLLIQFTGLTQNGPASFAVDLSPVPNLYRGPKKNYVNGLTKGFRSSEMPLNSAISKIFVNRPTIQRQVDRIDPSWVHGRDVVTTVDHLQKQHVILLGCGSIGSTVASHLAKSGVGRLTLVDPEQIVAANTSRHELGINALDCYKADFLQKQLLQQFPHMRQIKEHKKTWQSVVKSDDDFLSNADLIISTIGNWESEGSLNLHWLSKGRQTPLVVGWAEPYASAGHAVVLNSKSGCLSCHFEYNGKSNLRVTEWPDSTLKNEPACAAMFQPYSSIEIGHIHSLISRAAIDVLTEKINSDEHHRIWCAQHSLVLNNGGDWTKEWSALHPNMQRGGFLWDREWNPTTICMHCGGEV